MNSNQFKGGKIGLVLICAIFACIARYARPFSTNQNQYFAHAVDTPSLRGDWLTNTVDPYPVFSSIARVLVGIHPTLAPTAASWLINAIALFGVYLFSRRAMPPEASPVTPLLATFLMAASLALPSGQSFFQGFGGTYIISKASYYQPASFGVLIFVSMYYWLHRVTDSNWKNSGFLAAAVIMAVGCIMHPVYFVASAILLSLLFVSEYIFARQNKFMLYFLFGLTLLAVVFTGNPSVLELSDSDPAYVHALYRFAFERISHHTLWWEWPKFTLVYMAIIATAAAIEFYVRKNRVIGGWLALCLIFALAMILILPHVPDPKYVLMFPWRISVILVPISSTIIVTQISAFILRRVAIRPVWIVTAASVLAVLGLWQSTRIWHQARQNNVVTLVTAVRPAGTGLVPPYLEDVRLNARIPVYADYKSPPYASADLIEWWKRLDLLSAISANPDALCTSQLRQKISWILVRRDDRMATCLKDKTVAGQNDEWLLITLPPTDRVR